ncbi:MAG TPA: EAL domain-containing protein [Dyella sp.]|uniref:sensor domain-containing protein n=1 Tax=Dyella sp. TaxID=1869338 RepID=UPI002B8C1305|nr:EAL domain-containing protein [Dyella sp.]HTV85428.1 EAL domain-containing protein [Dyella sp.]
MSTSSSGFDPIQVFERISEALAAVDEQWRYTYVNTQACALLGRDAAALIGKRVGTEFPDNIGQTICQACERAVKNQLPVALGILLPSSERWLEYRIYPAGTGATIYFRDVTEQKLAAQTQQHDQQVLARAQEIAHLGSWEWDVASNWVTWSEELYRIYGIAHDQHSPTFEGYLARVHEEDRARVMGIIKQALVDHQPYEFEERIVHPDGEVRTLLSRGVVHVDEHGHPLRMLGTCQDVTDRKRAQQLAAGQHDILVGVAAQHPLTDSLERIARLHEELNPGALCSILLLDDSGTYVIHGAAPSLPTAYNAALNGMEIGDRRGSCGTAAWRRERIVVADIATHPFWAPYKQLALAHGLMACWSTPIFGSGGQVLGTFAVYYRQPREPRPDELESIDRMVPVAGVAIESARLVNRLRVRDSFFEMSLELFCIIDPITERLVQFNPFLQRLTGYSPEELSGRSCRELFQTQQRERSFNETGQGIHEFVSGCLCKDGRERVLEWVSFAAPDGLVYAVARDITERRQMEASLAYASSHDAITGLPNHPLFEQELERILHDGAPPVSVFAIGLDRFRVVNESVGHLAADEVLKCLAVRLEAVVHNLGHVARFAGDQFVIAVVGLDGARARAMAETLRAAIAQPLEGENYRLLLTASVGVSRFPDHGHTAEELLRRAEAAMIQAKREGRDQVAELTRAQMIELEDRVTLGSHLRDAVTRGELELYYQPQHSAVDLKLTGFEALLRWNSPQLGFLLPGRFIPVAEALGLMSEIGDWVIDTACKHLRRWLDQGHEGFTIAVNVSVHQLKRPGLAERVSDSLRRHGVPASMLEIEMIESAVMEDVTRARLTLASLKDLGTRLSLDDFGTGYSSLSYLRLFPIDKLKMDQSFVRHLPGETKDAAIVRTIVMLAHQLEMEVAAEGVETPEQAALLTEMGCDGLQGHYLSHALPFSAVEAYFRTAQRGPG